jgi:hypothetical protein
MQARNNWVWNARIFENVDRPDVKARHGSGSWSVTITEPDFAWGYCIKLPDEAQDNIMWDLRLDVRSVDGKILPGLALHDSERGVLFIVNEAESTAELRFLKVNHEAVRTDLFRITHVECPYTMAIEYNAITARCIGRVNGDSMFDFKLPHADISPIAEVTHLEIVTMSPPGRSSGTAKYGHLVLNCE